MELTLDQALQKGIEAHKAGKVQEADQYYTAILKAQPKHPDANHNMGVLAVGVGKVEEALPFFKTALEVNQTIAQFWLSYIDALIKLNRMDDAKDVFAQSKSNGLHGESFDQLEKKLQKVTSTEASNTLNDREPSQDHMQPLIDLFNQGKLREVLDHASQLLKQFPSSFILYNILGGANSGLGQFDAAIEAFQKAVSIKPDYADAYYNMGSALKKQSRFEEAITAYNKAAEIKPLNPKFHSQRGYTSAQFCRKALSNHKELSMSISIGDWEKSKHQLRKICCSNLSYSGEHVDEFISIWCDFFYKIASKENIKKLIDILIELSIVGERNKDVVKLIMYFFNRFKIDLILYSADKQQTPFIKFNYARYKYIKKDFFKCDEYASESIELAKTLLKKKETEDRGWWLVRQSLSTFIDKKVAREHLDNVLSSVVL